MLVVDIGNTRVKWARWDGQRLSPQQAAAHTHWTIEDWDRELFGDVHVDRVAAVTVAGESSRTLLVDAAARRGISEVQFVASTAEADGVRNGYRDPRLLGADRWAAVVGAYHMFGPAPCCIVDVGTAATVDAIDATGKHLGGFIVPGPRLMVGSLLTGTSDLAAHTAASVVNDGPLFADNTRDAIERGCRVTLAALVDRAVAELARMTGTSPQLVVTGGAAAAVAPYVLAPLEFVPDLVLYGVVRLAMRGS